MSGDANIEITNDTKEQGILLKPFQTVEINTTVYACRVSGGGTCALAVLPFTDSEVSEDETTDGTTDETTTGDSSAGTTDNSYSDYHGQHSVASSCCG